MSGVDQLNPVPANTLLNENYGETGQAQNQEPASAKNSKVPPASVHGSNAVQPAGKPSTSASVTRMA